MQWLIDIVKEWIIAQGYLTKGYVDRGFYGFPDFRTVDLTIDNAWHELDLSGIVDEGAKAAAIRIKGTCDNVTTLMRLRKHGSGCGSHTCVLAIQVSKVYIIATPTIGISSDRKIDYYVFTNPGIDMAMVIRGWWF